MQVPPAQMLGAAQSLLELQPAPEDWRRLRQITTPITKTRTTMAPRRIGVILVMFAIFASRDADGAK
jgi:hypothetical protein